MSNYTLPKYLFAKNYNVPVSNFVKNNVLKKISHGTSCFRIKERIAVFRHPYGKGEVLIVNIKIVKITRRIGTSSLYKSNCKVKCFVIAYR